jgi:hypothetical protein
VDVYLATPTTLVLPADVEIAIDQDARVVFDSSWSSGRSGMATRLQDAGDRHDWCRAGPVAVARTIIR